MKMYHDLEYLKLMQDILSIGKNKNDRTNTGTLSTAFPQLRFNISNMSIPLLTTKQMFVRGIIHELLWLLSGNTNIKALQRKNVNIWNEWADKNGDLGPIYGKMWREWPGDIKQSINYLTDPPTPTIEYNTIDQIDNVIHQLQTDPTDRRMIVNAWNPALLPDNNKTFDENVANGKQALPPCHAMFQFWSDGNGHLKCHLYQRSADLFLGVPFNIVQYSILTHMIAHITNHEAVEFVWTGGDVHIYKNHIEQCKLQLSRDPYPSPTLKLNSEVTEIDDFIFDDFEIENYTYHPTIKAAVSV